ncbi:phosphotransferase [Photobacterium sp. TLY01]|uniref:phosphotransferase n=1 Tax=Photobacterium sp. TLY01 TaxID=2907534 RepID=UPI001F24A223|nr:phosphotransferase [Photobacterium sp. TLY01]UIP30378.1 aminoglycoside phosphotransferase family protein [Photobacterium sp. TLY01]
MADRELTQMGSARVFLRTHNGRPYIEKHYVSAVEIRFYQDIAPHMKLCGIQTPEVYHSDVLSRRLRLEYIPHSISLEALNADRETFRQLAAIHYFAIPAQQPVHSHQWTSQQTEQALEHLQLPAAAEQQLLRLQANSADLFLPVACLSGDSNAGNWGRRVQGELVLFDWERFGRGSPAIDLAPLVKGMGNIADYQAIARRYLAYSALLPEDQLIREIILAKAWIVVEVVNLLTDREKASAQQYLSWFRQVVPGWLNLAA